MAVNPVIQKADSFEQNSKAKNDSFADLSNNRDSFILDVLPNDQGGLLKVLWSLDEGSGAWNEPNDLLSRDYDAINSSELGAQISITRYGTVSYVITPELQAKLKDLSTGESLTDTFIYAMKVGQGNSPLSWAKATVTLNGLNHAPELTGTTAILPNGTENTGYEILTSDLLKGFTDADKDEITIKNLLVTHGTLTETATGWIFTPESNFSGDVELSYDIVDGHGGSLGAALKFTLEPAFIDSTPPTLYYSEPADDTTEVPVTNNIVLHFDDAVTPGSGNIVVTNGTDTRLIAVDDSSQITFSGSKVIINPSTNLIPNTTYHIEIANGVIADYSGNPYAGIDDPSTLNFTTTPDIAPPILYFGWPPEGQPLKIDGSITLNFNEEILAGTGNIIISNGTDTRIIAIDDASQVTINNFSGLGIFNYGSITINPTEDLIINSTYNIQIAAGVITDTSGNAWEGITSGLSFNTVGPGPLLSWSNPGDDITDFQIDNTIELSFDEIVKPGSTGNIIISNGTDTRIISINDSSQVTFDGYYNVTINPTIDLIPNTHYNIQIDSGAITDLDGNPYVGISDDTTLDFSTITSEPLLYNSFPGDNSTDFQVDQNIGLLFNEPVKPGNSGNIIISNGTDTRVISINDSSQVTFDGYNGLMINPATDLVPNTHYSIKIDSGAITDLSGNPYAGIGDDTTLDFSTVSSEPQLFWSNPTDDSTGFQTDSNIQLIFNEAVQAGSNGNIVISNGTDTRIISINDSSQVTFDGYSGVMIKLTTDLVPDTHYSIKIDSGAITDLSGHAYAGISDDTALDFSTISSDPQLFWSNPLDNATDFQVDNNIQLSFNEAVQAGSNGNIIVSDGSDTRTISINDSNQVTFDGGGGVTINPTDDLVPNTHYSIKIDSGAITDLSGHAYAGISDDTALDFSTVTSEPRLAWSTPGDDTNNFQADDNITLAFNEDVQAGSNGNIIISNGSDTRTIAINDASQVTFNGSKITVNPTDDLVPNTNYNIQIDSGAVTDVSGHAYAGINDDTTLNFSTISSEPQLSFSNPWDNSTEFQVDQNIELYFNEQIKLGSSGNIVISNGSDTRTIAINDASQVTFDGFSGISINPAADLLPGTNYSIRIDSGAVTDMSGHTYAGINDDTTLNFSTVSSEPQLAGSIPWDDFTEFQFDKNIELYFNEQVKPGSSGNIVITNGSDTRTIAINDASQVSFDNSNRVVINPIANLLPNSHYSIKIDSGAITDLNGHDYAGINDDTTLDFSTITGEPRLTNSNPSDDSADFQEDRNIELYFNEQVKPGDSGNIIISNGSDTRTISINDSSQVTFDGYGGVIINPTTDLVPNTNYNIKIDSTAITDLDGNPYTGISDDTTLNFSTITGEPRLTWSTPGDDTNNFPADNNITLAFNEEVQAGSNGNIVISNGSDTRTIAINDASQVTFNGSKITVNPTADLVPNTNYSIRIDNGAITDVGGHAYAGINDNTTLNFSTIGTEPQLYGSNPWDDLIDFPVDNNITLSFNEGIHAGSSGNIVISNGSDTRTIAINDASQVTFDGYNSVIINPAVDLIPDTNYSIRIDSGAILDLSGNAYAGISDDTTLNFSTVTTEPRLSWSNPWDGLTDFQVDQNISLSFNQAVKGSGSGNIVISNGSDTRTIAISDNSQVTFDGYSGVIINPAADLIPNTHYSIKIDSGAITDLEGNAYAGISDDTTLDFSTITSEPRLNGSNPWDDSTDFQVDRNIELYFNEQVKPGSSGNIVISNGSDTRTITINDASQVSFDNSNRVVINPIANLLPNSHYSIKIDSGAITDLNGHDYAGINDDTTLDFSTITGEPRLNGSNPGDDSAGFQEDQNIELYFNEQVKPGDSGNIIISNGSDTRTIAINDASQVTFSGGKVTINPTADLVPNTNYSIKIDSTAITDLDGNSYTGISDDTTLNFATTTSEPLLFSTTPWDDSADFPADNNIKLEFNELVQAGSNGNIVISNGSDTRTIAINDSSQVTFDGYTGVFINPTDDLIPNSQYNIKIDNGAITDLEGNAYAGISDDTTLDFSTISSEPQLYSSYPLDGSTEFQMDRDIQLYFNELIKPGSSGNIVISNGSDTRTIAINDASQVSFDNPGIVVINPIADLIPDTHYNIKIDSGAITDLAGHAYTGISDDTVLDFTTIPGEPRLDVSIPGDDSIDFQVDRNIELYFNEPVKSGGSGNIIISNGSDTRTISINDSSQVTFDGYTGVIINPATDLVPNADYSIRIDSGAITDLIGNPYAGISNDSSLNFTTIPSNPLLNSSSPMDDAVDVAVGGNINLYFNEEIKPANGNIVISNGTDTRTISINDSSQVTFSSSKFGGNQIFIDPAADLVPNTTYHIEIDASAITDTAGNYYAGISDDTTLNFTTADSAGFSLATPLVVGVSSFDEQFFPVL